jgi:hypothetical protein
MAPYYHVKACVFRTKATFCEAKLETEWKHTGFIVRDADAKLRRLFHKVDIARVIAFGTAAFLQMPYVVRRNDSVLRTVK